MGPIDHIARAGHSDLRRNFGRSRARWPTTGPLTSSEQIWDLVHGSGYRATVDAMTPEDRTALRGAGKHGEAGAAHCGTRRWI
jgi:hypothetical protein